MTLRRSSFLRRFLCLAIDEWGEQNLVAKQLQRMREFLLKASNVTLFSVDLKNKRHYEI